MLGSVFAKTTRDRWRGWAIAAISLSVMLFLMMVVYSDIDLTLFTTLPEAYRSLIGISEDADVASLAISALMGSYGAMALGGHGARHGGGLHRRRGGQRDPGSPARKSQEPDPRAGVEGRVHGDAGRAERSRPSGRHLSHRRGARCLDRGDGRARAQRPSALRLPVLRLPGAGRRGLDREPGSGARGGRRSDGRVLLRGRLPAAHRGSGGPRQGLPLVLLQRQRSAAQRGRLGTYRRAARGFRRLHDRGSGRRQSPRSQEPVGGRHARRPAAQQPDDQEGDGPARRHSESLQHLGQDCIGPPGASPGHGSADVLRHGRLDGPDVCGHPQGDPHCLRGLPGGDARPVRRRRHQHARGLLPDRDVRHDGSDRRHGGRHRDRGGGSGRRGVAPDHGPSARQPDLTLEGRAREERDDGPLRLLRRTHDLCRRRAGIRARGCGHGYRQHRRDLPAADARRPRLRGAGAGAERRHRKHEGRHLRGCRGRPRPSRPERARGAQRHHGRCRRMVTLPLLPG